MSKRNKMWSVLLLLILSCSSTEALQAQKQSDESNITPVNITEAQLWGKLDEFEYFYSSTIKQAAEELNRLSPNSKTKRATLTWKMRMIPACRTLLFQDSALEATLEVWILSERMLQHFTTGYGKDLFGPHQDIAINASQKIVDEIKEIVQSFAPQKCYAGGCESVENFAKAHPIQEDFYSPMLHTPKPQAGEKSPFNAILNIPLAPFTIKDGITEGIDKGAVAIEEFTEVAERFTNNLQQMPESIRWQLLMLLYNLEEEEGYISLQKRLLEISESHAKLVTAIESYPQQANAIIHHSFTMAALLIILFFITHILYWRLTMCGRSKSQK